MSKQNMKVSTIHVNNLKRHVEAKHEGIHYLCDQCDDKITRKLKLNTHTEAKHKGILNSCDHRDN